MIESKKRLLLTVVGLIASLVFLYIMFDDIVNGVIAEIFMLSVIIFFTVLNLVLYGKAKRKEYLESR